MGRRALRAVLTVGFGLSGFASPAAAASPIDSAAWDGLVERHVADGRVNYAGIAAERDVLERYLASLAEVDLTQWSSDKGRLTFWINAYNACVVKGVLEHYPLTSVKDVKGFFDRTRYRVAGRDLTLNEIEAEGRKLNDWRVHFAVVCASSSCPPIRSEAYQFDWLEPQLTEQTTAFLRNTRDGLRLEGNTLFVSSIFKWYAKDFVQSKLTAESLVAVLEPYLDPAFIERLRGRPLSLKFLPYDWSLNGRGS